MTEFLFDPPWWAPVGIIAVGVYLFWSGNRKQDNPLRNAGLGAIALAVVLMLVAYFVDTPREAALAKTKQLVQAVNDKDWTKFASIIDPQTTFMIYRGKQELVDGAKSTAEKIGLKTVHVISSDARQNQTQITVDVSVFSDQDALPYSLPTSWRFEWADAGNGWYLSTILFIPRDNLSPDAVQGKLVKPQTNKP